MNLAQMEPHEAVNKLGWYTKNNPLRKSCLRKRKVLLAEEIEAFDRGGIDGLISLLQNRKTAVASGGMSLRNQ